MAARNRPRAGHIKDDLDEERHIWNTIVAHVKKLKAVNSRAAEVSKQIVAAEREISLDPGTSANFSCVHLSAIHQRQPIEKVTDQVNKCAL